MDLNSLIEKIGAKTHLGKRKSRDLAAPPVLTEPLRFPYGPFRFKFQLPAGRPYAIFASTDLAHWVPAGEGKAGDPPVENIDSEAFKFNWRFYRLRTDGVWSANVIGYASVSLPPGFSLIANAFDTDLTVSDTFKDWPDGTTINRFDTSLFRLTENAIKNGKWTTPVEKLAHAEGAIFFNPTSDYKSASFVGDVVHGNLAIPIPSGFSIRSSPVPQPGNLLDDLKFPISNGDVIHVFDRERQKYVLHPYVDDKWSDGPPILSVGEAFWVAKKDPGNWIRTQELLTPSV